MRDRKLLDMVSNYQDQCCRDPLVSFLIGIEPGTYECSKIATAWCGVLFCFSERGLLGPRALEYARYIEGLCKIYVAHVA